MFTFFFFNDTATTEIYTLSLHDALPISSRRSPPGSQPRGFPGSAGRVRHRHHQRSEEHTSELQSQSNLVCRLLLEKKKNISADSGVALPHYSILSQTTPDTTTLHPSTSS